MGSSRRAREVAAIQIALYTAAALVAVLVVAGFLFVRLGRRSTAEVANVRRFPVRNAKLIFVGPYAVHALGEDQTIHNIELKSRVDERTRLAIPAGVHGLALDLPDWAAIRTHDNALVFNGTVIPTTTRPLSLAFTRHGQLIALMADGSLAEVTDNKLGPIGGDPHQLTLPVQPEKISERAYLRSFGDTTAVIDLPQNYIATLNDYSEFWPLRVRHYRWSSGNLASSDAAVLSGDRVAVVLGNDLLLLTQGKASVTVHVGRPIAAISNAPAAYRNAVALVALQGGGVRTVDAGGKIATPEGFPDEKATIRMISPGTAAFSEPDPDLNVAPRRGPETVAYTTDSSIVTFDVEPATVTAWWGSVIIALALLAVIAILFVAVRAVKPQDLLTAAAPRPPLIPIDLPPPPPDLVDACIAGDCVVFAGSELSDAAGVGSPAEVVERLLQTAIDMDLISATDAEAVLLPSIRQGDVDTVLDAIADAQGDAPLDVSRAALAGKPTVLHRYLGRLTAVSFVTPNLDEVLDRAVEADRVVGPADVERTLELSSKRERFVLKLRGTAARPESFESAMARRVSFAELLRNLFLSRTMLFIGADLEEIGHYLSALRLASEPTSRHYALVHVADEEWKARVALLDRRYGLRVLPYTDIAAVERFLAELTSAVDQTGVATLAAATQASRLISVELQYIGPFVRQEFEFDSRWTVLLGNNGVGKSNVLRALAVALAGKAAEPYAGRIVRSGATLGTITIRTSRGRYVTEVHKRSDGTADVKCPVNILEAERWLALGFPPLRMMTWQRGAGSSESRPRPTAQDVQPLATGGADPRVDELKNWIVQQRVNSNDEKQRTGSIRSTKYDRLLDTFFRVVNQLTPKLEVRLGHVDVKTKEVQILSEGDLPVPIESVSQGTISLLGWIGIIVQRLYDIYGDSEGDPLANYALVLVDEIDAHMHPEWQKRLAPLLEKIFDRIQFVATTHSPLIVSEMRKDQVYILTRAGKRVEVVRPEEDLSALRADQMLTSLFGLSYTRSKQTEDEIKEYVRLLGMRVRDEDDERRFRELRAQLSGKLTVSEIPVERGVERVVRETVAEVTKSEPTPTVATIPNDAAAKLKEQLKELFNDEDTA